jgi:DNA-binding CsgD family transcriptional regulator
MAIIFGISPETVRSHVKGIFRKLDCSNAAAAVGRAYELGILRA